MTQLLRPVGYTGTLQTLTIPENFGSTITAYLWGGGGGGGGGDYTAPVGGTGSGGGYAQVVVPVSTGDVLSIAIGGGGGGGIGQRGSAAGGGAGASYVADQVFNLANVTGYRTSNPAWCGFLNTYGVWDQDQPLVWDSMYSVSFPSSGYYTFTSSCDNYATIYVDGVAVMTAPDYRSSFSQSVFVPFGVRTIRIVASNYGGPAGVALVISGGSSYSGGRGGNAGGSGSSGAGGGGGGATVLFLNGTEIAVAGGGGGGGGAGRSSGGNSPGPTGQSGSYSAGQSGQDKAGDGGGGGAGGGGVSGGNGGYTNSGDVGAVGGSYGSSLGDLTYNPDGPVPGAVTSPYYSGRPGYGGSGSNRNGSPGNSGYAVFVFDVSGLYVNDGGSFAPVNTTYVKNNDVWTPVKSVWVKDAGVWKQVQGGQPPTFGSTSSNYGVSPRDWGVS